MKKYLFIPIELELLLEQFQLQWLSTQSAFMICTGIYVECDETELVLGDTNIKNQSGEFIQKSNSVTMFGGTYFSKLIGFCIEANIDDIPQLPIEVLVFEDSVEILDYINQLKKVFP